MGRKSIAVVVLIACCTPALFAGGTTANPVTIVAVDVRNDGTFLVNMSQPATGSPACATVTNRMTGDSNTPGGRSLLQVALSAYLSGKQVYLDGTGVCTEYPSIESLYRLVIS